MIRVDIVKRQSLSGWRAALLPLWAILATLAISSLLILIAGANPISAFYWMFRGALGTRFGFLETCVGSVPLIFTGLAVAFAFRAKFWNIGAEGQFLAGAIAASSLALTFPPGLSGLAAGLAIASAVLAAILAGGAYAFLAAFLKSRFKVDDVVSTLLLNYLMYHVMGILLFGPLQASNSSWPVSATLSESLSLPVLISRSRFHLGVILALLAVATMWVVQNRSLLGYQTLAVGTNRRAASFGGIDAGRVVAITALISGGLAGLAGASEVMGVQHKLLMDISPGYGYTGVVVAMLGQLQPLGVLGGAFFFSVVGNGADTMSRMCRVPAYISEVIQGLSLLCMLVLLLFRGYSLKIRRGA